MRNRVILLLTSLISLAALPNFGIAAEVLTSTDSHSNTPHIRTLAATCAACHGNNGNSAGGTPALSGIDGAYFTAQMLAFQNGERVSTVMQRHAKGLNIDEINLLAYYFSRQKPVTGKPLKSQSLRKDYAH